MKNYNYGLIGNCSSAVLISSDCSIDWLCLPFFDSTSLFAKILDEQAGGFFKIDAEDIVSIKQSYIRHTAILKTVFETKGGVFEVRDYMPRFLTAREEYYCPSELHRDIYVVSGKPKIKIQLDPRPNYAIGGANFKFEKDYIKITSQKGEYNSFYLYSNLDHQKIVGGEPIELEGTTYFLLSYHEKIDEVNQDKIYIEYERTKNYWLSWVYRTKVPNAYREMVVRSAITLKLLMYQKTGAVIAAPTTSLPEIIGKDRNWDYRYCWVRDASMIIDLYARMGHVRSSGRYIGFILNRMLLKHENISVMYGINGEKDLDEKVLDHLSGYENSKPVRIGNAAYLQKQNDLYGELIETIYTYFVLNQRNSLIIDEEIWTVVRSLVNDVIKTWQEPDSGIWEHRSNMQHFVHSKLMGWVAMDRAAKIAKFIKKEKYAQKCSHVAQLIKEDILANGWNSEVGSFTMYYGSKEFDASNLLMLHYGFLDNKDERIISTVKQSYKYLVKNDFTLRYTTADDFGLPENAFIVCSFWMINALYLIGEEKKARDMFEHILKYCNPLGLFSEDIEINTGRLTGNFPQGYSHLAFIQTVLLLETDYNWTDAAAAKL